MSVRKILCTAKIGELSVGAHFGQARRGVPIADALHARPEPYPSRGSRLLRALRCPASVLGNAGGWVDRAGSQILVIAGLCLASGAYAQTVQDQPVILEPIMVDGRAIASGAAVAQIGGLRKGGDGFVSVRGAPSVKANERGRLTQDRYVLMLTGNTAAAKSGFVGVIYVEPGDDVELEKTCGIENPIDPTKTAKRIYKGPCKSGWVAKRFVRILAD